MKVRAVLPSLAAFGLLSALSPCEGVAAETLAVVDARGAAGVTCPRADGVYLVLLVPGNGSILLATRSFPGARQVGSLEGDRLRFSLPGHGSQELRTASLHEVGAPIWGALDEAVQVGGRSGCLSFGDRAFTSVGDLWTYIHWLLRDVVFRLRSADDAEPLALRLADRTVTLEVSAPGHRPVRLRVEEAGTVGLRLPGSESIRYFQPFIVDERAGRLAIKVLVKDGAFFGEGTAREIAFVHAGREAPGVLPGEPTLEVRCSSIE